MTLSFDISRTRNAIADGVHPPSLQPFGSDCSVRSQVSLASLTSLRVGGPAQWYLAPRCLRDLKAGLAWARAHALPVTLIGAGSNLLIGDRGLPGLTLCTRRLRHMHFDEETGQVTVAAGEPLPKLAWQAAARGWSGLEWAVGIPGTVGGAVVMNAGAHQSCTADYLVEAKLLCPDGTLEVLTPRDLGYRYRTSCLQGGSRLVIEATFQLQPGNNPQQLADCTAAHFNQRRTTQPYHLPSCGSVFRNPEGDSAGWLIEQTGLKGYRIGAAQVSQRHANFILNTGGATADDVFRLIQAMRDRVEQAWNVRLETEVRILGEFSTTGR